MIDFAQARMWCKCIQTKWKENVESLNNPGAIFCFEKAVDTTLAQFDLHLEFISVGVWMAILYKQNFYRGRGNLLHRNNGRLDQLCEIWVK